MAPRRRRGDARRGRSPSARLDPIKGTEGCYAIRMEYGDPILAPSDTDSGAIERDEVAITYLSRLHPEPRDDLAGVDGALAALLGGEDAPASEARAA